MADDEPKDLELKSLIGFDGKPPGGLLLHPDGVHLVYPLGTKVTAYNYCTKAQRFYGGLTNVITAVAVSITGRYVAAGQVNTIGIRAPVIVWDFESERPVARYEAHMMRVESLTFSRCESYVYSLGGLDDGAVVVFDVGKDEVLCTSSSVRPTVGCSTVLKPLQRRADCFVVAGDNTLKLWTLDADRRIVEGLDATLARIKRNVLCVEIDCTDEFAYCGTGTGDVLKIKLNVRPNDEDGKVSKYQRTSPTLIGCFAKYPKVVPKKRGPGPTTIAATVELFSKGITSLSLIADGTIVVGSGSGAVELVGQCPRSGNCKNRDTGLSAPTHPLFVTLKSADVGASVTSIQPLDDVLLVGTVDCELFMITADRFHVTRMFTCHTSVVYDLAFPQGFSKVFATAGRNDVRVWSVETLQELLRVTVPNHTCSGALFTGDGTQLITSWDDGRIRVFTPRTGRQLYVIENCHNGGVTTLAVSSNGRKLITGGGDGQVRVWCLDGMIGTLLAVLKEHKGPVSSVDVHPQGHQAVSVATDGTCVLWDIVRYTRLSINISTIVFTCVRYTPDGTQLLTCGTKSCIGFWESLDGSLSREIEGSSSSAFNSLDITASGKYIVTGGSDQTVKVWLYDEGQVTHIGMGHADVVTNVKISPDGRFVVSTSADGGIFLWRFPHESEIRPDSSQQSIQASTSSSASERQMDRSRDLSQRKTMPIRKENINDISNSQKVRTSADSEQSSSCGGDSKANVRGSVKCLCRPGQTCACGDDISTASWKCR